MLVRHESSPHLSRALRHRALCTPLHLRKTKVATIKGLPPPPPKKKQVTLPGHHDAAAAQRKIIAEVGFDFAKMGIGGLSNKLVPLFRRVFASRLAPPEVVSNMGVRHTKGVLLHGPPGTGKTLVARQIGKMLGSSRPPKLVSGPELFGSLVGESEASIRELFLESEREYRRAKENSALHVIIFDEIDAVCKHRGGSTMAASSSSRVHDNVVNQLLTKIDGLERQDNVLVIGITNRLDLIDEAILRPGRLEVHIELGLPDTLERLEILLIHTKKLRANGMLRLHPAATSPAGVAAESSLDAAQAGLRAEVELGEGTEVGPEAEHLEYLERLANAMENFSGAEVEATIVSAVSFALERVTYNCGAEGGVDVNDGGNIDVFVTRSDLERALTELLQQKLATTGDEVDHEASELDSIMPAVTSLSDSALAELESGILEEKVRRLIARHQ